MYINDNMTIKWEDNGNRYCMHIRCDSMPDNPRSFAGGPISIMACWHRRYSLGDDIGKVDPQKFWQNLVQENVPESEINEAAIAGKIESVTVTRNEEDSSLYDVHMEGEWDEEGLRKESIASYILDDLSSNECQDLLRPYAEWLPLWLYDHSGITMSCGTRKYPYNDVWDSGQVGYIVATKNKMISEFRLDPNDDEAWRRKAIELMKADVETYDQYLTGEVYWYQIYKFVDDGTEDGDWDEEDACSGFYGNDLMKNGILNYSESLKTAIENNQYEVGEAEEHVVSYWSF